MGNQVSGIFLEVREHPTTLRASFDPTPKRFPGVFLDAVFMWIFFALARHP